MVLRFGDDVIEIGCLAIFSDFSKWIISSQALAFCISSGLISSTLFYPDFSTLELRFAFKALISAPATMLPFIDIWIKNVSDTF
jgi:hypothetical protein